MTSDARVRCPVYGGLVPAYQSYARALVRQLCARPPHWLDGVRPPKTFNEASLLAREFAHASDPTAATPYTARVVYHMVKDYAPVCDYLREIRGPVGVWLRAWGPDVPPVEHRVERRPSVGLANDAVAATRCDPIVGIPARPLQTGEVYVAGVLSQRNWSGRVNVRTVRTPDGYFVPSITGSKYVRTLLQNARWTPEGRDVVLYLLRDDNGGHQGAFNGATAWWGRAKHSWEHIGCPSTPDRGLRAARDRAKAHAVVAVAFAEVPPKLWPFLRASPVDFAVFLPDDVGMAPSSNVFSVTSFQTATAGTRRASECGVYGSTLTVGCYEVPAYYRAGPHPSTQQPVSVSYVRVTRSFGDPGYVLREGEMDTRVVPFIRTSAGDDLRGFTPLPRQWGQEGVELSRNDWRTYALPDSHQEAWDGE